MKGESNMTYYEILEISEKASQEVIRMAYKALCKKYHPDICQGDKKQAEERMKKINEAYDTLSDETKKRQYDYFLNNRARCQQSYYTPKQENNVPNADALVKRGFMALEYGEWIKAENFFEQALNQNAGLAEAYLGKLMVELRVKTRNALKDCPHPFNDKINYKRAYSFADSSLKRFLQETIQYINKRNYETQCSIIYNKACLLMRDSITIQGFQAAIAEFEKISEYKDSAKKIEYCYEKIAEINSAILAAKAEKEKREHEAKCNNIYNYACALMRESNNIQGFKDVIAEFEKIREYKDSSEKIEYCYKRIAEINSSILAAELEKAKRKAERKEAFIKKLPLMKKIAFIVVPVLIIAIVAASILPKFDWNGENLIDSSLDVMTSNITTSENISSEEASSLAHSDGTNKVDSSSSTDVLSPSGKPSYSPPTSTPSTSTPSTSTSVSSSSNSDKPAIFGSSNDVNITEGDFVFAFRYDEFGPVYVEVTLIEYNGNSSNVNIPSTVAGYPVTSIGGAFRGNKSITSVNIPKSVKNIDPGAFIDCSSLTSINIPHGVTNIYSDTFLYCFSLTSVQIPSSVTYIGTYAFAYCRSLTSITIPDGVTYINGCAFWFCESLTKVTIPNNVTNICESAFNSCTSLTSVTIPNNVTTIGPEAFICCYSLKTVTIPDSVTSIAESAFNKCEKLEIVYFKSESQMNKYAHLFDSSVELKVLE